MPKATDPHASLSTALTIHAMPIEVMAVKVVGTAPLIVHRFDEKARRIMLEAQQSKTRKLKEARDPLADYEASMYRFEDGRHGFPAAGFKAAMINACSLFDGITKVLAKQVLYVIGEGPNQLIEINAEPTMREDVVRLNGPGGSADLRFRAQYWPWTAVIPIRYSPSVITADSVAALLAAAGHGGVGEWRPSSPKSATGSFGTFDLDEG